MAQATGTTPEGRQQPSLWTNIRFLRIAGQAAFSLVVLLIVWFLYSNLMTNLANLGQQPTFDFLGQPAGFDIAGAEHFSPGDSMWDAIVVGLGNTITVGAAGLVLATLVGLMVGIGRLSGNWLVRKCATVYVETFRNIPVLVIILFCYLAVFLELPPIDQAFQVGSLLIVSVRGIVVPWVQFTGDPTAFLVMAAIGLVAAVAVAVWRTKAAYTKGKPHHRVLWALGVLAIAVVLANLIGGKPLGLSMPVLGELGTEHGLRLTPEFAALLVGLTLYTASHIAEIVRASILAVPKGQVEAADALALTPSQRMRLVVLPQAMRIMIPPLANQYLNLVKNSSLAVIIAFPELSRIVRILIGQRAPAPQATLVLMAVYLGLSLVIALVTGLVNWRLGLKGGRR